MSIRVSDAQPGPRQTVPTKGLARPRQATSTRADATLPAPIRVGDREGGSQNTSETSAPFEDQPHDSRGPTQTREEPIYAASFAWSHQSSIALSRAWNDERNGEESHPSSGVIIAKPGRMTRA